MQPDRERIQHGEYDPSYEPIDRDTGCPFAPPSQMLKMNGTQPLVGVRIGTGRRASLITGMRRRGLFADPRVSVDDRLDDFRLE